MEIGVAIPHFGAHASAGFVRDFCQAAEALGFDGLWASDHLVAPVHTESTYDLGRRPAVPSVNAVSETMGFNLEQYTTLAFVAGITHRPVLGTSVTVLSLRNPVLNARQLASIDQYCGGRLLCGVGIGWLREEAEAMGMPWADRGARAEEHVALMRTLWTAEGETVEFHGRFSDLPPMSPDPRPVQRPIPILIGGHSRRALDRAARIGDGWIGSDLAPDRLADMLGQLDVVCHQYGRDRRQLRIVCSRWLRGRDGRRAGFTDVHALVAAYEGSGVDHLLLNVRGDTAAATLADLEQLGGDLLADRTRNSASAPENGR